MRYNSIEFNKAVRYYKNKIKNKKIKNIFIHGKLSKGGFLSIAPLSKAAHELKIDLYVTFNSNSYSYLKDIWDTNNLLKNKKNTDKTIALKNLIHKINIKGLSKFFKSPDIIIESKRNGFYGDLQLENKPLWFTSFMSKKLKLTTDTIVKNVYAIKKSEHFGIGFPLIPNKKSLSNPLQDYLDSYAICYSMYLSSKNKCKNVTLKSSTTKPSFRSIPEKISELLITLTGLELEKNIDLPIFKEFKQFSKLFNLDKIKISQASFFIAEKGYHGKHLFGEKIGYPTKNKKSKWSSPGGIIYKFHSMPQSKYEDRDPIGRYGFTSTVPIDKLIQSSLIDYNQMRKRNKQIARVLEKCDKVFVKSNIKNGCDFEVSLVKKGVKRIIFGSDSDVRTILDQNMLKRGKRVGHFTNIPGGEAFTTPFYVKGRVVGDVVINTDKSHRLTSKNPFIVDIKEKSYKIISGPKNIISSFNKIKKDAWTRILELEKNKSLPQNLINLKKKNFEKVGEFAINTNPHATPCDYLIINEKIANMIHVAFGSGFEPDASTEYHMDVVIDCPRQKLDIYGIDSKHKEYWIIKKGHFVL
jgi:hypothetical protein